MTTEQVRHKSLVSLVMRSRRLSATSLLANKTCYVTDVHICTEMSR